MQSKNSVFKRALVLAGLLLAGCQSSVYMMLSPAALSTSRIDVFAQTLEEEQASDIFVAYATHVTESIEALDEKYERLSAQ
jgi:hypothetical protein